MHGKPCINAIEVPDAEGVKLHHITTVWLNGVSGSEVTHIVNGLGGRVHASQPESAMRQTLREFTGGSSGNSRGNPIEG